MTAKKIQLELTNYGGWYFCNPLTGRKQIKIEREIFFYRQNLHSVHKINHEIDYFSQITFYSMMISLELVIDSRRIWPEVALRPR